MVGVAASSLLGTLDTLDMNNEADLPPGAVLVSENFISKVVSAGELSSFTSCKLGSITQRILVPVPAGLDFKRSITDLMSLIAPQVEELFDSVLIIDGTAIQIHGQVSIGAVTAETASATPTLVVEWKASPLAGSSISTFLLQPIVIGNISSHYSSCCIDLIADSAVGLILQLFSTPSVLRITMSAGRRKCASHAARGSRDGKGDVAFGDGADDASLKGAFSLRLAEDHGSASKRLRVGDINPSNAIPKAVGTAAHILYIAQRTQHANLYDSIYL